LEEHKARYSAIEEFSDVWRVCGGTNCLRDTTIKKRNAEYSSAAGLKKIRIHDFRRPHASLLASEGINIQEVALRPGHSNIKIA
jgi:integrase